MTNPKPAPGMSGRDKMGGESQGGAYPNPHDKQSAKDDGFHGGQSDQAYHGHGQLGEEDVPDEENANAPSKDA